MLEAKKLPEVAEKYEYQEPSDVLPRAVFGMLEKMKLYLRQHPIHRGNAQNATCKSGEAIEEQVPAICRGLPQIKIRRLCQLGGHAVVKIEQDGDDDCWHKGSRYVYAWNPSHVLQHMSYMRQPMQDFSMNGHCS